MTLLLDDYALILLAQLIMMLVMTGYLLTLSVKRPATWLIFGVFACLTAVVAAAVLEATASGAARSYAASAKVALLVLTLVPLQQFAYRFTQGAANHGGLAPEQRREATAALGLALLAALALLGWSGWQALHVRRGAAQAPPPAATAWIAAGLTWAGATFVRRAWWAQCHYRRGPLRTQLCAEALAFAMATFIGVPSVLQSLLRAPAAWALPGLTELLPAFVALMVLCGSGILYFTFTPETTSFLAKLVGSALAVLLFAVSLAGALIAPPAVPATVLREARHVQLLPLAALMVVGSVGICLVLPPLYNALLVRPLTDLVVGVQAVNRGDLEVQLTVRFQDEIGVLTSAFNQMVTAVRLADQHLEQQVVERTQALVAAKHDADKANQAKSRFLATMSHELRTPLHGMLGYAQLLQRDATLTPVQHAALATIAQSGHQLLTLINDLLDLAKVEANRFELELAPVTLRPFVSEISTLIALAAAQKGLRVVTDIAAPLPATLVLDGRRLRQVLLNVLGNAIKFTNAGGVALRIAPNGYAPARAGDVVLHIAVSDTGDGIPAARQAAVFEPFEQEATGRLQGGTGLGLAISRQLVAQMNGQLQLISPYADPLLAELGGGAGSCFWFELTAAPAAAPAPLAARPAVSGYHGPHREILILDDYADHRHLLRQLLERLGFTVREAADGHAGLAATLHQPPDLIVTDLVMPGLDGAATVAALRRTPSLAAIPIIVLSASIHAWESHPLSALAAVRFLPKPMIVDDLLAQIQALLGLRWICVEPPASAAPPDTPPALVLPPAELATLHELARCGSLSRLHDRAAALAPLFPDARPFLQQVQLLASAIEDEQVLALIEEQLAHA